MEHFIEDSNNEKYAYKSGLLIALQPGTFIAQLTNSWRSKGIM